MGTFAEELERLVPEGRLRRKEPMEAHTTFRAGGPADYYVEPENGEMLWAVLDLCRQKGIPFYILGNGSNLLVGDLGYPGVMVAMGKDWSRVRADGCSVRAGAGALLSTVAKTALKNSLTGLEFAAGIPGTVGGAVVMNAGAYGSDMSAVLEQVTVLAPDGRILKLEKEALGLGYRRSCIQDQGYVVLEAEFGLESGQAGEIQAVMEDLAVRRRTRQPLEYPSAGSTFKRPEGYFAGKLIEEAGLKGLALGGAQVSEKHCGFVINRGQATAADVLGLCRLVQKRVKEHAGVTLELEVKLLGDFGGHKYEAGDSDGNVRSRKDDCT